MRMRQATGTAQGSAQSRTGDGQAGGDEAQGEAAQVNRRDQRSTEAEEWRKWYHRAPWRNRRAQQLRDKPLCERCEKRGHVVTAIDVDHVIPHKGDWFLFINGELQSLCRPCHSGDKQSEERRGYSSEVDASGVPTDPRHPWHGGGYEKG